MMKTGVRIALCALLLINLGLADHTDDPAASSAPGAEEPPEAPATAAGPGPGPDSISHAATEPSLNGSHTDPSPGDSGSLNSSTTVKEETVSVTPEPKKVNDTVVVSPSEAAAPGNNGNQTANESASQPPVPPSGSDAPPSQTPPAPPTTITGPPTTTSTTTIIVPPPSTTTGPTDSTPMTTASADPAPLHPDVTPSNQPTHGDTHSSTPAPTSEPPKLETTTTAAIMVQSSSTSSTGSSPEPPTSPHDPTQSHKHHETPTASPSTQARPRADTPSQLNVGGDPTMVHDSPTLDPLLAGLVSAFIITAVIITLLLFLKLRRRDNRPEFRRLQDLPMDDMMEDTPLSMYSY